MKDKYPGAGSVQLAALGAWLVKQGFQLWDLGMELEYKLEMGARVVPRSDWAAWGGQELICSHLLGLRANRDMESGSQERATASIRDHKLGVPTRRERRAEV